MAHVNATVAAGHAIKISVYSTHFYGHSLNPVYLFIRGLLYYTIMDDKTPKADVKMANTPDDNGKKKNEKQHLWFNTLKSRNVLPVQTIVLLRISLSSSIHHILCCNIDVPQIVHSESSSYSTVL